MDRLVRLNLLVRSGGAVVAAGDVVLLLLDKLVTITIGDRQASEFRPLAGVDAGALADAALLSSLADETPEGRSIVALARERSAVRVAALPAGAERSEERRVGQVCVSPCRSRWSPSQSQQNKHKT